MLVIDYMTAAAELPPRAWMRTYRANRPGGDPLDEPGAQDITADVVVEQLLAAANGFTVATDTTQAAWLRMLGIEALAEAGAQEWRAGSHRGDLDALTGRSRAHEAGALTDPSGLGARRVVELAR